MNIGRICNREVVIAQASDPLSRAAREMCDQHVGMVVVVEERDGKRVPIGVVTDRDIVRIQLSHSADLFCLSVGQAMTGKPLSLLESESLVDAIDRLRVRGRRWSMPTACWLASSPWTTCSPQCRSSSRV